MVCVTCSVLCSTPCTHASFTLACTYDTSTPHVHLHGMCRSLALCARPTAAGSQTTSASRCVPLCTTVYCCVLLHCCLCGCAHAAMSPQDSSRRHARSACLHGGACMRLACMRACTQAYEVAIVAPAAKPAVEASSEGAAATEAASAASGATEAGAGSGSSLTSS